MCQKASKTKYNEIRVPKVLFRFLNKLKNVIQNTGLIFISNNTNNENRNTKLMRVWKVSLDF